MSTTKRAKLIPFLTENLTVIKINQEILLPALIDSLGYGVTNASYCGRLHPRLFTPMLDVLLAFNDLYKGNIIIEKILVNAKAGGVGARLALGYIDLSEHLGLIDSVSELLIGEHGESIKIDDEQLNIYNFTFFRSTPIAALINAYILYERKFFLIAAILKLIASNSALYQDNKRLFYYEKGSLQCISISNEQKLIDEINQIAQKFINTDSCFINHIKFNHQPSIKNEDMAVSEQSIISILSSPR